MANTVTEWVGTTTDGAIGSNWSNGLPDDGTTDQKFDGANSKLSLLTNYLAIRARATLAGSLQPADGDTITLDVKTYTFQTVLTNVDGNVFIGATVQDTHDNLKAAVNLEAGAGSKYASATTLHPTATGLTAGPTTSIYAAKDGGTGGNSIVTTDVSVNWAWTGGTMAGGAADGAVVNDVFIGPTYPGDIHSTGNKATFNGNLINHRGSGSIFLKVSNVNRILVNSINYRLAADLEMVSSLVSLEIIRGRIQLNAPVGTAMPDEIIISDSRGVTENLLVTGSSALTGAKLIVAPGFATVNGPNWTLLENTGTLVIKDGAVSQLDNLGVTLLETTKTMAKAYVLGGLLDLREGPGGKTVTVVYLGPLARFESLGDDIDTFVLREIGIR